MKKEKILIIICVFILAVTGLLMVYSSSYVWSLYKFNTSYHYILYQAIFLLIGLLSMHFIMKIDINFIKKKSNLLLFIGFLLLTLVLIPGIGVVRNGSRSWFSIGPFGFQPSELIKIILIIFVSKYLEKYHDRINNFKSYLFPLFIILSFLVLLIMLEPDFGTLMIIILTIISMLFISGLKMNFFIYLGIFGLIGIIILIVIAPYRLLRIISFINPWSDPLGSGYQIIQSLYAIGPAGLFGHGLFSSVQKNFYLPEPQTDFIFSILCEELGFIFALFIIVIFIILYFNMFKLSINSKNIFNKMLIFGVTSSLVIQTTMNLAVVVGLIPVTGVTLPFFSYGGSSLLTSFCSIGLVLNASKTNSYEKT